MPEQKLPPAPVSTAQRTLGILVDVLVAEHEPGEHVGRECVLLLGPVHREHDDGVVAFDGAVLRADVETFEAHGPAQ